jgi:two-component system, chemotaxis family, chemotaxis protein CheY
MPSPTLLVVDDDKFVRNLLRDAITESGLEVRVLEARDGQEGLELARRERPSVMLLDLFMPRRSGLEVLTAIRESSPETRVLIISSMDEESLVEQALTAGAVGFVGKPFHPLEIALAIREALAH